MGYPGGRVNDRVDGQRGNGHQNHLQWSLTAKPRGQCHASILCIPPAPCMQLRGIGVDLGFKPSGSWAWRLPDEAFIITIFMLLLHNTGQRCWRRPQWLTSGSVSTAQLSHRSNAQLLDLSQARNGFQPNGLLADMQNGKWKKWREAIGEGTKQMPGATGTTVDLGIVRRAWVGNGILRPGFAAPNRE